MDPNFCKVGELLSGLNDTGAKVTVAGPSPAGDYESFDDLIAEANADFPATDPVAADPTDTGPAGKGSSGGSGASSGPKKKKKKRISFA